MALAFGSLFAGIGGFDKGFHDAGLRCAWQVEVDPDCRRVLAHHWPDALLLEDVRDCGKHNLPPVDIISFGSPCQDLSVAGKRKGMAGERSGLFYEAARIVRELRPALAVWENVPGAFSSHAGGDFAQALHALRECGARDLCWRVLDARYFGVAQRRRRVFLVADFGGQRAGPILLESPCGCGHPAPGSAAEPCLAPSVTPGARRASGNRAGEQLVSGTLGATGSGRGWNDDLDRAGAFVVSDKGNSTWVEGRPTLSASDDNGTNHLVAHTLRAEGCDASEDGTGRGTPLVVDAYISPRILRNQQKKPSNQVGIKGGEASDCLQSDGGGGVAFNIIGLGQQGKNHAYETDRTGTIQHKGNSASGNEAGTVIKCGMMVRRLTPLECCRLQGFPDDWLDLDPPLSDSAKYRMLGNAVCVPVARWIGRRIMESLVA